MNSRADYIIPECYVDTNLIETLLCTSGCNHQKGCNQVTKVMQEKFAERFAVGIIDADKRKPSYVSEFSEVASSEHLKLFRHTTRCHFIIFVCPAIEGFILSCAKENNINVEDYKLSPSIDELTLQSKNVMSNKDTRFKSLFKTMGGVGEMKLMKDLITYLIAAKYNASSDDIIRIFSGQ